MNQQGWTKIAIANKLGISTRKVFRFLKETTFPERKGRSARGRSLLSPYKKYLLERWNEGCHNGTKLYQEIIERGYQGRYGTVAGYIRRLRKTQKLQQDRVKVFEPKKSLLTLRRTVKLILLKPSQQSESDKNIISLLKQQHPQLNTAIELIQRESRSSSQSSVRPITRVVRTCLFLSN
ncbi:MAG: hypothetical protein AB4368_29635 [Xenococcaceae cyanobacterium]